MPPICHLFATYLHRNLIGISSEPHWNLAEWWAYFQAAITEVPSLSSAMSIIQRGPRKRSWRYGVLLNCSSPRERPLNWKWRKIRHFLAYIKKKHYLCAAKVKINSSLYKNSSDENFKHPTRDAFWLRERKRQQCTKEILYCWRGSCFSWTKNTRDVQMNIIWQL